jgi:hypothetical protein
VNLKLGGSHTRYVCGEEEKNPCPYGNWTPVIWPLAWSLYWLSYPGSDGVCSIELFWAQLRWLADFSSSVLHSLITTTSHFGCDNLENFLCGARTIRIQFVCLFVCLFVWHTEPFALNAYDSLPTDLFVTGYLTIVKSVYVLPVCGSSHTAHTTEQPQSVPLILWAYLVIFWNKNKNLAFLPDFLGILSFERRPILTTLTDIPVPKARSRTGVSNRKWAKRQVKVKLSLCFF